jgi:hypothetical protein
MSTLALVGDVIGQHGLVLLAAGDDLSPSESSGVNLNLTLWSGIASFATPFLVALVNQPTWKPVVRVIITVLVSLGMAAATVAIEGKLTGVRWTTAVLVILAGAVFWYQTALKNVAPALEAASSPGAPRYPHGGGS